MSNPRNRRRTLGAFGHPKPRVSNPAFRNRPAAAPQAGAPQGGFNISDALINFARPITEQAGNNHTAIRGAMNVAILLWNAIIEGETNVKTAREKLVALPGATPEQIEELITTMTARKAELYPDAKQLVCDYTLDFTKHGARISVASINLTPPGVEKTEIAGQLGAVVSAAAAETAPTPVTQASEPAPADKQ
ncbi:MAG: hypothetical protein LBV28_00135 [Puniceicoccales bacterium]|jgi:hypothetical protein|nr:hypothetical protein [Puniceicoccales bacterium]